MRSINIIYQLVTIGYNRAILHHPTPRLYDFRVMMKSRITKLRERNETIDRIIKALTNRRRFLVVGHKEPDEDCIASIVAMSLLLSKFDQPVVIFHSYPPQEQLSYLFDICRFNNIDIIGRDKAIPDGFDTIIVCDTPKPELIDAAPGLDQLVGNPEVLRIELDHHLGADSDYIGDKGYRLVDQASSTCELIGIIAYKINRRPELLERFHIQKLLTRNLVIAILTGIVGDSKMGAYLKTRREKRYYRFVTNLYNSLLTADTTRQANIGSMEEIYQEIQQLSSSKHACYRYILEKREIDETIGLVVLDPSDIQYLQTVCNGDTLNSVSRRITDELAEESGRLGLMVYYDFPDRSPLVQCKLRRSKSFQDFDLRRILTALDIKNGGGHEGAIGFRFPRETVDDVHALAEELVTGIKRVASNP